MAWRGYRRRLSVKRIAALVMIGLLTIWFFAAYVVSIVRVVMRL